MAFRKSRNSTKRLRKSRRSARKTARKSAKRTARSRRNRRYLGGVNSSAGLCEHGKIKYSCPICKCKYMEC